MSVFAALYSHPSGSAVSPAMLLEVAETFSPRYEQHRDDLVSIDVRGLERLFGTPRAIGEEIRRVAAARGVMAHVGVAATRTVATVMALAKPGLSVVAPGEEAATLAPLPLSWLEQIDAYRPADAGSSGSGSGSANAKAAAATAAGMVATLRRWGLRSLGELAALPASDLAARTGRVGLIWQQIARGADARPLVPTKAEERFEATLSLEWPIEGLEPLSFVLTRLLEPLSTRLERADRGAAALQVSLRLTDRSTHERRLEIPAPLRDVRALRTLALLDLEAHPPSAPIDSVAVTIDPTPARVLQHTLFTRPHPTPEQLSTLLARLGALMGQSRVGTAVAVDSYRPGEFEMKPFALEHSVRPASHASARQVSEASHAQVLPEWPTVDRGPRPSDSSPLTSVIRRYRQPIAARVAVVEARPARVTTDRASWGGGAVTSCAGPWRTSGAWWEMADGAWDRDEWDVALADGGRYRLFQDRVSTKWFIEAEVD